MADVWYFADGTNSVGPLSLDELKSSLQTMARRNDVLVWSPKYSGWKRATEVDELRTSMTIPNYTPPPLPEEFRKDTTQETTNNAVTGILITVFVAFAVIKSITPDTDAAIRLIIENWTFWLPMMIAGLFITSLTSKWKFLFAALLAILPLLAIPGMLLTAESRAYVEIGSSTVAFLIGLFTGQAIKRRC